MITVKERRLIIPSIDRCIGVEGDNKIETRQFEVTETSLFAFDFKLNTRKSNGEIGIIDLIKTVEDDRIILTWIIQEEHLLPDKMKVQLRAFANDGSKWHSNTNYFQVGTSIKATAAFPSPLPSEFEQMEQRVTAAKNETLSSRDEAVQAVEDIGGIADHIDELAGGVEETAIEVNDLAGEVRANTIKVANDTATTADNTQISQQAMADLLAMLGSDVATLTNGKLTHSQVPAIAITDTFVVSSQAEMLALICETGDIAIRTDQNKTYILQGTDPSVLSHWQQLQVPTNYADTAGHAATADNAENANKINNKRLVAMTESQYNVAVKEENTFYAVVPD